MKGSRLLNGFGETASVANGRDSAPWIISGIGIVFACLSLWYLVSFGAVALPGQRTWPLFVLQLLELLLLGAFSIALVYAGYWLATSQFDSRKTWWAGLWTLLGLAGIVGVVGLVQGIQLHTGRGIRTPTLVVELLLAAGSGGVAGLLIGVSTAEATESREKVSAQRDTLEFLNQLLRHNVLNGMQIIMGHTALLREEIESEQGRQHIDAVETQGQNVVDLVENVRTLSRAVSDDAALATVDLSTVLREEVANARAVSEATVETDIPDSMAVRADDLLSAVFENLLSNAVEHNDAADPHVRVTARQCGDTALVTVADNGPGVPDADAETYFEAGEQDDDSVGQGLGLYLVDTLVDRYGGDVWIETGDEERSEDAAGDDAAPSGAVFKLELPLAAESGSRDE